MAELLPRHIYYAFIVFVVIIAGGLSMMYNAATTSPSIVLDAGSENTTKSFNNSFNKFTELKASSDQLSDKIGEFSTNPGVFGFLDTLIGTSYNTLKTFYNTIVFVPAAVDGLTESFNIPWWVTTGITIFIFAIITFAIFSVIFQRDI